MSEVVDSHVHLWDLARRPQPWIDESRTAIRRDFGPADLDAVLASSGVGQAVLVQVLNDAGESADLIGAARACASVGGVVGWVDLAAASVAADLDALVEAGDGLLVGVRHQALAEPDPALWWRSDAVRWGLDRVGKAGRAGLAVDVIVAPGHLTAVRDVVRAHPEVSFVLDHLGKPPIAAGAVEPWRTGLRALAGEPNVTVKLSGLLTVADWTRWTVEDLRPYVAEVLDAFGAERVMYGSDWPVSLLAAPYSDVLAVTCQLLGGLSDGERDAVLSGTARRVYRLTTRTVCRC